MKRIVKYIPNTVTCLNLLTGAYASVNMLSGRFSIAFYAICFALLFDFMDGFLARILNAKSDIGVQLDSLADVVSFGFTPGCAMYMLLMINIDYFMLKYFVSPPLFLLKLPYVAFLITVFSALRLAKFNIDKRQQTKTFIGLPTPANAFALCSLPFIFTSSFNNIIFIDPVILLIITFLSCYLLVSNIPMFSLKFEDYTWTNNKARLIFLVLSAVFIVNLKIISAPIIVLTYIIISIIIYLLSKIKKDEIHS